MRIFLAKIYEGPQIATTRAGLIYLRIPADCTIKAVRLMGTFALALSTWRFNVRVNGAALFSGDNRPTFSGGIVDVTKTGLNVAALQGQILTLDIEQSGAGRLDAPITLIIETDDGVATGIPNGGTTGQYLAKMSDDDGDVDWVHAIETLGGLIDVDLSATPADGDVLTFDEDTETWIPAAPATSGGASYNAGLTVTTSSIADGASATATIASGKTAIISKITVDEPCRVRIYRNAAALAADSSRPIGEAPDFAAQHLLVVEHVFTTGNLSAWMNYAPIFVNAENPRDGNMPINVTNLSGSTAAITVDMEVLVLET